LRTLDGNRWNERSVERKPELRCKSLRHTKRHQLETGSIIALHERRSRLTTDLAAHRIRDESFGALSGENEAPAAVVGIRLFGNEKNDRAGVTRRITGRSDFSNLPLAPDAKRNVCDFAALEVRQRYDSNLAARFGANVFRDTIDALDSRRIENVSEVVDEPRRRRNLRLLLRHRGAGAEQQRDKCKRRKL
jgi:hypothetical protein